MPAPVVHFPPDSPLDSGVLAPSGRAGRLLTRLLLPLLLLAAGARPALAADGDVEARVKAAYVFHVLKYVDWPSLPQDNLKLCIFGSDGVTALLGELAGKPVKERTLQLETLSGPDFGQCQVLYIGRTERRWQELLGKAQGQGLLTLSDYEGFARAGGIIGFVPEAGKIRLEVNPEAIRRNNLKVSAKLLELARTVP